MLKYVFIFLTVALAFNANASYQSEHKAFKSDFESLKPLIVKTAKNQGVHPTLLSTVAFSESRFNPKAVNKQGSSATGLMGMTRPTARSMVKKHGKELGLSSHPNLKDPEVSLKLGAAYLKEVRAEMTARLNREITPAENYLGFKKGPGTAVALIKSHKHRKRNGTIATYKRDAAFYANVTVPVDKPVQLAFAKTKDDAEKVREVQSVWKQLYGDVQPSSVVAYNSTAQRRVNSFTTPDLMGSGRNHQGAPL